METSNSVVTELNVYPVKSCHGVGLEQASFTPRGIERDRSFLVITDSGEMVTQRSLPGLALVEVQLAGDNLILSAPPTKFDLAPLVLPIDGLVGEVRDVNVFDSPCRGLDQGQAAAAWLTAALGQLGGQNLRLLCFQREFDRLVDPFFVGDSAVSTNFADGFPYLVIGQASLVDLNRRLVEGDQESVPMNRFRPNLVISGLEPYQEDNIDLIRFIDSGVTLKLVKPCARCVITTTDQSTAEVGREPLRTLGTYRVQTNTKGKRGIMFGQNAILVEGTAGDVRTGEGLEFSPR